MPTLDTLGRLIEAATEGPWRLDFTELHGRRYGLNGIVSAAIDEESDPPGPVTRLMTGSGGARSWTEYVVKATGADNDENDYALIVALRNSAPTLLACARALEKCREKFDFYAQLHRLKSTAGGDEKADRNQEMADMCAQALSDLGAVE